MNIILQAWQGPASKLAHEAYNNPSVLESWVFWLFVLLVIIAAVSYYKNK